MAPKAKGAAGGGDLTGEREARGSKGLWRLSWPLTASAGRSQEAGEGAGRGQAAKELQSEAGGGVGGACVAGRARETPPRA